MPASAVASRIAASVASKGKSCTSTLVTVTSVFNGWDGVDPATLAGFDPSALGRQSVLAELRHQRVPVMLYSSCVRTGLHSQLAQGRVPATLHLAESDKARLFMEKETLVETWERLPRFADQMGVPLSQLRSLFGDHWLPLISVVSLSDALRKVDPRATAVLARDPDDYPTAALAALLSPCILLTRNHKDFAPLGVRTPTQGVDAILAVIEVRAGETQLQAVAVLPAAPVLAVGGVTKWAADRVGPAAYVILAVLVVGGIYLYRKQPEERKETIRNFAVESGKFLMEQANQAMATVNNAEEQLGACLVPGPEKRSPVSAVLRHLAFADSSMSAQQLCDALDDTVRPAVPDLRAFLHKSKPDLVHEARRGRFLLGNPYHVTPPSTS